MHTMHVGEGVDVVDHLSKWSQSHRSGTLQYGIFQVIEELICTRRQLIKQGQPAKFSMLHSFSVFHVLDPHRSMAYQHLARHAILSVIV